MTSSVPAPRPSEPLPCPFCGSKAVMNTTGAGCTNTECDAHLANVYLRTWNRRSPSVPTAIQEHAPKCECGKLATCYGAYENQEPDFSCDECCGHGNEDGWCKHFSDMPTLTARLSELRERASSEEAANSDTERLDWLEANGGFSHDDVDRGMSMSQWGRNWDKITLREAIDKAKLAARVQGEDA